MTKGFQTKGLDNSLKRGFAQGFQKSLENKGVSKKVPKSVPNIEKTNKEMFSLTFLGKKGWFFVSTNVVTKFKKCYSLKTSKKIQKYF